MNFFSLIACITLFITISGGFMLLATEGLKIAAKFVSVFLALFVCSIYILISYKPIKQVELPISYLNDNDGIKHAYIFDPELTKIDNLGQIDENTIAYRDIYYHSWFGESEGVIRLRSKN